jgi:hypothetical protein
MTLAIAREYLRFGYRSRNVQITYLLDQFDVLTGTALGRRCGLCSKAYEFARYPGALSLCRLKVFPAFSRLQADRQRLSHAFFSSPVSWCGWVCVRAGSGVGGAGSSNIADAVASDGEYVPSDRVYVIDPAVTAGNLTIAVGYPQVYAVRCD